MEKNKLPFAACKVTTSSMCYIALAQKSSQFLKKCNFCQDYSGKCDRFFVFSMLLIDSSFSPHRIISKDCASVLRFIHQAFAQREDRDKDQDKRESNQDKSLPFITKSWKWHPFYYILLITQTRTSKCRKGFQRM